LHGVWVHGGDDSWLLGGRGDCIAGAAGMPA
jgi:hypothetical protein